MPHLDLIIIGAGAAGIGASRAAQPRPASPTRSSKPRTASAAAPTPRISRPACRSISAAIGCTRADINPLVPEADRLGVTIDRDFAFSAHLWLNGRHATPAETNAYGAYFDWAENGAALEPASREDRDVLSLLDTDSPYFTPYAHVFSVIHAADPDQVSARDAMSQG